MYSKDVSIHVPEQGAKGLHLIQEHRQVVCYNAHWKIWLVLDETYWKIDEGVALIQEKIWKQG